MKGFGDSNAERNDRKRQSNNKELAMKKIISFLMENCGFHAKEIRQVLTELYEVFDFCAVEEAADYFENWQS